MSTAEATRSVPAETRKKSRLPLEGELHNFLPVPHYPDETRMLPAGVVTFGVESRIFATEEGEVRLRGASIHVFDSATLEEWLRFDWFEGHAHYHYLHPADQTNTLWGYDQEANGDLFPWAVGNMRERLPVMLRKAGAIRLAEKVETEGFDKSVLDRVLEVGEQAYRRTFPGTDLAKPFKDWEENWKRVHPQFDTYD